LRLLWVILSAFWSRLPVALKSVVWRSNSLSRVKTGFVGWVERHLAFDDIYGEKFYVGHGSGASARSYRVMAKSILRIFRPRTVLDVGCGFGELLAEFAASGARTLGLEYAEAAIRRCREKGIDVRKCDLTSNEGPPFDERFDLVVSMEVAEHLPATCADRYLDLLCRSGDTIVFTAAVPGQGGRKHVNEQPHQYWIEKFQCRGFRFLEALSMTLREEWRNERILAWYHENLMCFQRPDSQ